MSPPPARRRRGPGPGSPPPSAKRSTSHVSTKASTLRRPASRTRSTCARARRSRSGVSSERRRSSSDLLVAERAPFPHLEVQRRHVQRGPVPLDGRDDDEHVPALETEAPLLFQVEEVRVGDRGARLDDHVGQGQSPPEDGLAVAALEQLFQPQLGELQARRARDLGRVAAEGRRDGARCERPPPRRAARAGPGGRLRSRRRAGPAPSGRRRGRRPARIATIATAAAARAQGACDGRGGWSMAAARCFYFDES